MLDSEPTGAESGAASDTTDNTDNTTTATAAPTARRRRAASRPAGPPRPAGDAATGPAPAGSSAGDAQPAEEKPEEKPRRRRTTKKAAAVPPAEPAEPAERPEALEPAEPAEKPAKRTRKKAAAKKAAAEPAQATDSRPAAETDVAGGAEPPAAFGAPGLLFQAPAAGESPPRRRSPRKAAEGEPAEPPAEDRDGEADASEEGRSRRRRRGGRGRRGRGRSAETEAADAGDAADAAEGGREAAAAGGSAQAAAAEADDEGAESDEGGEAGEGTSRRRRRRRRRGGGENGDAGSDDPPNTVVRVREPRKGGRGGDEDDTVRSLKGSTRLEAKKQRRREGREAGRRRPSIITEAEFLARRESVERLMVVRENGERTQIAVLEDGVLAEHYVSNASTGGLVGNVYLGKVQNVLPAMEAAFVDVGKGRNAVLYAGEVNWDAAGLEGQPKRIEQALKSGDSVLVQATKDPIGHKGARLTSQVSLAGRYLVYVPGGSMTGISRKLPENERARLKSILKKIVPDEAGVIVRTAAEGASEDELVRDVARLTAQWEDIEKKAKSASAPALLYGEPDLSIRVVRDIFNEDFARLVVSGDDAWDTLEGYVGHVAPDLADRLERWTSEEDVFAANRIDEQIAKALDRKVWLPSGGYLVIDRTEAMVVVDVNTGKFTGQGGNLEETVTKNNLEAAEEVVRQLRLRDLGGIIVIDFIDMVLESNRDLVLRRLLECLGRDRTKHQVAEVTSLGLVQMTRKRVGQGLAEAFSETCECCNGRGVHVRTEPVEARSGAGGSDRKTGRGKGRGKTAAAETGKTTRKTTKKAEQPAEAKSRGADAEPSPVALEDPVEPPTLGSEPADKSPAPARRRRRKAAPAEQATN